MTGPELVLIGCAAYALAGVAFALWFAAAGAARLDPAARGASRTFRALLLPGSAALWPVLAVKCVRHKGETS